MKLLILLAALLLPTAVQAQTVCVILNGATTAVLGSVPCDHGQTYNPPATTVDKTDARYTAWLAIKDISLTAAGLLQTGVGVTFSTTTSANDTYPATSAAIQNLLNLYLGKVTIGASALVSAPGNSGNHSMSALAFKDVYNAVVAYNAAVLAAQATAVANNAVPVWPVATATSAH